MSIDIIKQSELTAGEREVLANDRVRWKRMGGGAHLDEWLAYGPGLMIRRRLAMRVAFVNQPEGKGYAHAFKQLMEADGLHTMDKTSITAVLWLHDNPEHMSVLREICEALSPGARSRLNSPISARQRVEKVLKARAGGTEENLRISPVSLLKQKVAEQERRIAHLQEQLAAAEHDGSLFDLKHDSADDIVAVIGANVTPHKVEAIAKGLTKLVERKRQRPAG
jgi:hypothetical protein